MSAASSGGDPRTFVITCSLLAAQVAVAAVLGRLGLEAWYLAVAAAILFGAFANHANLVVIHDAIHNLVFQSRVLNRVTAIVADLPNAVPTAMGFRVYHLKHHMGLSTHDHDADVPSAWEVRLVGNSAWRKAVWLFFFPVVQMLRLSRLRQPVPLWRPWTFVNVAAIVVFDVAVLVWLGPNALFYLLLSFWFSVGGLHPLSARWLQEHFGFEEGQGTFDYYGPLNRVALNIGYHNEHHDFHDVPWSRLPQITAMAPEFYVPLASHGSWARLPVRFVCDPAVSLGTRSVNFAQVENIATAGARP